MIEIFKAENPQILEHMYPTFNDFEEDNEWLLKDLFTLWAEDPENTCLMVAFQDRVLKAYVFGYARPDKSYVWIELAWGDPDFPIEHKREAQAKLEDWAIEKEKYEMQMQTTRLQVKAWDRLYGYKEHAIIMRKEL